MTNDNPFVDGLIVKAPREGAPDFVKGAVSIKTEDLLKWLEARKGEEWINIDIKESRGGKWYASVNEWKKEKAGREAVEGKPENPFKDEDVDELIPF